MFLKCVIQWLSVYSQNCVPITFISFPNIIISPQRNFLPISSHSSIPHLRPLRTTNLCSMSTALPTRDTSNEWSQTIRGLLCLASSILHNVFKFHTRCSMYRYFIPFVGSVVFCGVDTPKFACPFLSWWMFRSTLWLLRNSTSMNIRIEVFLWTCIFSSFGIAGSYSNSRFNLLRNSQTLSQSSWTILHSYQQRTRAPISPPPPQHLFLHLLYGHLAGMVWCLTMAWPACPWLPARLSTFSAHRLLELQGFHIVYSISFTLS